MRHRFATLVAVFIGAGALLLPFAAHAQQDATALNAHLLLTSPQDYQVFQRSSKRHGVIQVRGSIAPPVDALEVRLRGDSLAGPLPGRWQKLIAQRTTGDFRADLDTPAGGFYSFEIRALRQGRLIAEDSVAHVGVGEVFVICGQSNSTNYGETKQTIATGMVTTFDGTRWRIANDPQPGTQDHSQKGSFIPPFGDELYRHYHLPVGIASVGHGSTSVRQWLPADRPVAVMPSMTKYVHQDVQGVLVSDGTLFEGLMTRIGQLGKHGFRAVLWHQGESDAHQQPGHNISAGTYRHMLTDVIQTSRRRAGWNIPWFVAQASYHSPTDPQTPELREAQSSLWHSGIALEGPDTDSLIATYRQDNGKGVHLNDAGLKLHGHLWALRVESYLDRVVR
ncbi:MAG TPA: sialate O-acetylesterase [Acidobacteriaceae bacterium]